MGWGCVIDGTTHCTGGRWNEEEKKLHINHLGLEAIYLGLKGLCSTKVNELNHKADKYVSWKADKYVSWKADPGAIPTDALSIDWSPYKLLYCFPPFSLIGKVLQKIQQDHVNAIIVVPNWQTQFWYPLLARLMVDTAIKIKNTKKTLLLPYNASLVHPLYLRLQLLGCLVSGKA